MDRSLCSQFHLIMPDASNWRSLGKGIIEERYSLGKKKKKKTSQGRKGGSDLNYIRCPPLLATCWVFNPSPAWASYKPNLSTWPNGPSPLDLSSGLVTHFVSINFVCTVIGTSLVSSRALVLTLPPS